MIKLSNGQLKMEKKSNDWISSGELCDLERQIRNDLKRDFGDVYYESHDEEMNILVERIIDEFLESGNLII